MHSDESLEIYTWKTACPHLGCNRKVLAIDMKQHKGICPFRPGAHAKRQKSNDGKKGEQKEKIVERQMIMKQR